VNRRAIRVHAFASAKGGVGKSSLAVGCARIVAEQSGVPVLIDADVTGSSLADGLALVAPRLVEFDDDGCGV
jgi:MinD-like ATPase involved in chromosome partitioning or flagellar assembly